MNVDIENLINDKFEYNWEQIENINTELNNKIEFFKKTLAWVYHFANPEHRQQIVNHFNN